MVLEISITRTFRLVKRSDLLHNEILFHKLENYVRDQIPQLIN